MLSASVSLSLHGAAMAHITKRNQTMNRVAFHQWLDTCPIDSKVKVFWDVDEEYPDVGGIVVTFTDFEFDEEESEKQDEFKKKWIKYGLTIPRP